MKSLKLQRGMSLVELLVALAIGAFLIIGAVTVQSQTRKTFSVNEQQARLQETARFVLSVIEPDVQLAGLYGFSNIPDGVRMSVDGNIQYASDMRTNKDAIDGMPAVLDSCGANYVVDVTASIQADDGDWSMVCDPAGGGYLAGTDTLTVRRSSVNKVDATKGRIQLYTNRLAREDQVLFMDGVAPGPLKDDEKEIRDLIMQTYYVSPDSEGRPNLPSLRLKQISNDAGEAGAWDDQEVVRGVEDIQIELGVDPGEDRNADGAPDDIAADGMADWVNGIVARYVKPGDAILSSGQVVAVRIWVRVRAEEPEPGFEDNRIYNYGSVVDFSPDDGFRRVVCPARFSCAIRAPSRVELNMINSQKSRQRGAALIIGLILLAIITLLAVVGMNISNSELASATSEQLRMRAFQAAETGLEHGTDADVRRARQDPAAEVAAAAVGVEGSPLDSDGQTDRYLRDDHHLSRRRQRRRRDSAATSRGFHYSVVSRGAIRRAIPTPARAGRVHRQRHRRTAIFRRRYVRRAKSWETINMKSNLSLRDRSHARGRSWLARARHAR